MRRTIALLVVAGALAGCGADKEEGASTAAGGATQRVVLSEFAIDPANPKLKAGDVTFDVANEGSAPHALEIEGAGVDVATEVLDGGRSEKLEADLKAGSYEWYCPVGNHADQGMKGTLTVE